MSEEEISDVERQCVASIQAAQARYLEEIKPAMEMLRIIRSAHPPTKVSYVLKKGVETVTIDPVA